jgi:hypothetical protein
MIIGVVDIVREAVERLQRAGVGLTPGLSDKEFARIEEMFAFSFSSEHRRLLAVPVGDAWVDWRSATHERLRARVDWPVDSVIFDVHNDGFWPLSWGVRPGDSASAARIVRDRLTDVPKLVPIYAHRYLPASPAPVLSPVLSVYQTDVIYYGDDLLDYVAHEFRRPP